MDNRLEIDFKTLEAQCRAVGIGPSDKRCLTHDAVIMLIKGVEQPCIVCDREAEQQRFAQHAYQKYLDEELETPPLEERVFYLVIKNMFFRRNMKIEADALAGWYGEFGLMPGGKVRRVAARLAEGNDYLSPTNFAKLAGIRLASYAPAPSVDGRIYFKGGPTLDGKALAAGG